ncbi:hypothetical protein APUTEX25_001805, partial [Auxenochlorella protothecoides]
VTPAITMNFMECANSSHDASPTRIMTCTASVTVSELPAGGYYIEYTNVLIGEVPAMLASIVSSARTGVLVVGRGFSDVRALGRGEMARVCTLPLYLFIPTTLRDPSALGLLGSAEKAALVAALLDRADTSSQQCSICCDDYVPGDVLRALPRCQHKFHLECVDRWFLSSAEGNRKPPIVFDSVLCQAYFNQRIACNVTMTFEVTPDTVWLTFAMVDGSKAQQKQFTNSKHMIYTMIFSGTDPAGTVTATVVTHGVPVTVGPYTVTVLTSIPPPPPPTPPSPSPSPAPTPVDVTLSNAWCTQQESDLYKCQVEVATSSLLALITVTYDVGG